MARLWRLRNGEMIEWRHVSFASPAGFAEDTKHYFSQKDKLFRRPSTQEIGPANQDDEAIGYAV